MRRRLPVIGGVHDAAQPPRRLFNGNGLVLQTSVDRCGDAVLLGGCFCVAVGRGVVPPVLMLQSSAVAAKAEAHFMRPRVSRHPHERAWVRVINGVEHHLEYPGGWPYGRCCPIGTKTDCLDARLAIVPAIRSGLRNTCGLENGPSLLSRNVRNPWLEGLCFTTLFIAPKWC